MIVIIYLGDWYWLKIFEGVGWGGVLFGGEEGKMSVKCELVEYRWLVVGGGDW